MKYVYFPAEIRNLNNKDFLNDINILRDLTFSLNLPLKSADDWYTGILKNIIKTLEYIDLVSKFSVLIFTVT